MFKYIFEYDKDYIEELGDFVNYYKIIDKYIEEEDGEEFTVYIFERKDNLPTYAEVAFDIIDNKRDMAKGKNMEYKILAKSSGKNLLKEISKLNKEKSVIPLSEIHTKTVDDKRIFYIELLIGDLEENIEEDLLELI